MKANQLGATLLLLSCAAGFLLAAEQSKKNDQRPLKEIKA